MNMPSLTQVPNRNSSNTLATLSRWKYYFEKWSEHIAMLSNHNPHHTCKRFHHQHSLPHAKRGKKKLYWSFTPFLPGIPISPRGLSSTFVDKSHICVPFWRLLIVLNWRNYSQGTAVCRPYRGAGGQTAPCKVLPCVSSTSNILFYSPLPAHSEQCHWVWVVHSVHLYGIQPYFIFSTSMR